MVYLPRGLLLTNPAERGLRIVSFECYIVLANYSFSHCVDSNSAIPIFKICGLNTIVSMVINFVKKYFTIGLRKVLKNITFFKLINEYLI